MSVWISYNAPSHRTPNVSEESPHVPYVGPPRCCECRDKPGQQPEPSIFYPDAQPCKCVVVQPVFVWVMEEGTTEWEEAGWYIIINPMMLEDVHRETHCSSWNWPTLAGDAHHYAFMEIKVAHEWECQPRSHPVVDPWRHPDGEYRPYVPPEGIECHRPDAPPVQKEHVYAWATCYWNYGVNEGSCKGCHWGPSCACICDGGSYELLEGPTWNWSFSGPKTCQMFSWCRPASCVVYNVEGDIAYCTQTWQDVITEEDRSNASGVCSEGCPCFEEYCSEGWSCP